MVSVEGSFIFVNESTVGAFVVGTASSDAWSIQDMLT